MICTKAFLLFKTFFQIDYVNEYLIRNLDKSNWDKNMTPIDPSFDNSYDLEMFPFTLYVNGTCKEG